MSESVYPKFSTNAGGTDASTPFHSAQQDKTPDLCNISYEFEELRHVGFFC